MFGIDDDVIGSLAGTALSSGLSFLGGSSSNKAAQKAAEVQMAFQRESQQNAHQWEVADLRKAGLNPILSANAGAPMAAGASYTPTNALAGAADTIGKGSANAVSIANIKADTAQKLANAGLASTNARATQQNMNLKGPLDQIMQSITPAAQWAGGKISSAAKWAAGEADRNINDVRKLFQNYQSGMPSKTNATPIITVRPKGYK